MKNKKIIILVLILLISIGFALISANFNLSLDALLKSGTFDVRFDNFEQTDKSVNISKAPTITGTSISFAASIYDPGDMYQFTIDVVNVGDRDAMVNFVNKTGGEKYTDYIDYKVEYITDGIMPENYDILRVGESEKLLVTVKYKEGQLMPSNTNCSFKFELEYVVANNFAKNHGNIAGAPFAGYKVRNALMGTNVTKVQFLYEAPVVEEGATKVNVSKDADVADKTFTLIQPSDPTIAYIYVEKFDDDRNLIPCKPTVGTSLGSFLAQYAKDVAVTVDVKYLDVSKATDISGLFENVNEAINYETLDIGKVTSFSKVFYNYGWDIDTCFDLDLTKWNMSNVKSVNEPFGYIGSDLYAKNGVNYGKTFVTVDVSGWNLESLENATGLFKNFAHTTSSCVLNATDVNFSNVKNMDSMFENFAAFCLDGASITGANTWNTSRVTSMNKMFYGFGGITDSYVDNYDSNNNCTWDVSKVTSHEDFSNTNINFVMPSWVN